jgi:hypothetical protein
MLKRVIIPSSVVLTRTVLSGAMRKLPTDEIEATIDTLIEELDCRAGDPDFEPDSDE